MNLGTVDVILLHSGHQYVSATHVTLLQGGENKITHIIEMCPVTPQFNTVE
jgi:hypothetical protein